MTIKAAPIASGAIFCAPGLITVQPMVNTRKKVPMNSTTYLFIARFLPFRVPARKGKNHTNMELLSKGETCLESFNFFAAPELATLTEVTVIFAMRQLDQVSLNLVASRTGSRDNTRVS